MSQNKASFSFKEHLLLWASGALSAFLIIGIFWVSIHNDLDAARMLAAKGNSAFEKTEESIRITRQSVQELHDAVKAIIPEFRTHIFEELSAARELVRKSQTSYDMSLTALDRVKQLLDECIKLQQTRDDNMNQKISVLSAKLDKICAQIHCE